MKMTKADSKLCDFKSNLTKKRKKRTWSLKRRKIDFEEKLKRNEKRRKKKEGKRKKRRSWKMTSGDAGLARKSGISQTKKYSHAWIATP